MQKFPMKSQQSCACPEAEEVCAAADMALTTRNSADTCTLMIAVFVTLSRAALLISLEDNLYLKTIWGMPLPHQDKCLMYISCMHIRRLGLLLLSRFPMMHLGPAMPRQWCNAVQTDRLDQLILASTQSQAVCS